MTGKMGCTPILSAKVSTKMIKGAAHKNGDVDGTCKRNLNDNLPPRRFGRFSNCYELPRILFYSSLRPRLNVVKIPVRREDACKPTLLPDGRTVYRCTYCSKDFGSFSDINRHMDFHEGRGKFHFPLFFSTSISRYSTSIQIVFPITLHKITN